MASRSLGKRKQFMVKADVLRAIDELAHDSGQHTDVLVDEAMRDLLKKYRRPLTIKDALRTSVRNLPANDLIPQRPRTKA